MLLLIVPDYENRLSHLILKGKDIWRPYSDTQKGASIAWSDGECTAWLVSTTDRFRPVALSPMHAAESTKSQGPLYSISQ